MKLLLFVEQPYSVSILRPLQTEALKRGYEVSWFLMNTPVDMLDDGERLLKTIDEAIEFNPDAVICPGNWPPFMVPGLKVHTFHGCGINKDGHFKIRGLFDLYCTHGPNTTDWHVKQAEKYKYFNVVETGWPKLDTWTPYIDVRTEIANPVKVLYLPTFSKSLTSGPDLVSVWASLAKLPQYDITMKFHPLMSVKLVDEYRILEGIEILSAMDILPAIDAADIVVSDTSSAIAESLFLGKPVITYRTEHPGKHVLDIKDAAKLPTALDEVIQNYADMKTNGATFIGEKHPYRDGLSSARILDAVVDRLAGGNTPLRKLPPSLLRKHIIRKKMKAFL